MPRSTSMPRQIVRNFGTCLNFAGGASTDNVTFTDSATLDLTTNLTISAWIKPRDFGPSNAGRIVSKDSGSSTGYDLLFDGANKTLRVFFNANLIASNQTNTLVLGVWQHVAVTFDSTAGSNQLKFYVNGTAAGVGTLASDLTANTTNLKIGNGVALNRGFNGLIDEVKLYNRTLTPTEISEEYYGLNQSTTGLVLYTKFNEGSGTSAIDSSGNQAAGTITGATYSSNVVMVPRTTAGQRQVVRNFGTCLSMGSGGVQVTETSVLKPTSITLSCWIKPRANSGTQTFIRQWDAAGYILRGEGTAYKFYINTNANKILTGTTTIKRGEWIHLAATYNQTTGLQAIYLNGVLDNSATVAGGAITYSNASGNKNFNIGSYAGAEAYNGLQDDVRVYSTDLTATQILNLYYGIEPPTTNLIAWHKFDEGSGTVSTDSSVSALNGTITTATYSTDVFMISRTAV